MMNLRWPYRSPYDFSKSDYYNLITSWEFDQRGASREIGIIGAGMSGLVAGWLLKRAGHKVTILEASNVVGGRVKTLRDRFTNGFYAEAGAMRVPDHHKLTMWLIDSVFRLKRFPFLNKCRNNSSYVYLNNKRHRLSEARQDAGDFAFDVAENENNKTADDLFNICLRNYMKRIHGWDGFSIDDLEDNSSVKLRERNKSIYESADKLSLRHFLMEEARIDEGGKNISQGAVDFISSALVLEAHMSSSMAAILGDLKEVAATDRLWQIKDGMDNLPRGFVTASAKQLKTNNLNENIIFNARVVEIESASKLDVTYENPITRTRTPVSFDLVVIATPFSSLRHVRMKHLTSPEKRRALRQLHYDNSCKILMEFNHCFWANPPPGELPIVGGSSITDLPIKQTIYASPGQNENSRGNGVLLASYTWGDDSLRWTSLKHDDRIRFALRDLERVHGLTDAHLEPMCIGGVSHSWAEHEFTSGAFAMFEPYQRILLFPDVWRPEGRIHYCGEHTSTKHAWIEGAVESGVRVANEICERVEANT
jgi:monoamine oxidase